MKRNTEKVTDELTHGSSIKHIHIYADGWQAYCANEGLSRNQYKRFSEKWISWKTAFIEAKEADKKNILDKVLPANLYRKRHNNHK